MNRERVYGRIVFLFAGLLTVLAQAAVGPTDPTGAIQCKSNFYFFSQTLGEKKFAELGRKTKLGPEQLGKYREEGPSFAIKLDRRGSAENEVDYYLGRIGVKIHSSKPSEEHDGYDVIFHANYTHHPKWKSSERVLNMDIVQLTDTKSSQNYYHVIPGEGINGFTLKHTTFLIRRGRAIHCATE